MAKGNLSKTDAKRVYSYIRFSTPEQAMGDSERRQLEVTRAWAKRNGHAFDESLRMTDRGLSGYHGTHRKKGALGNFLSKVESGDVPKGSILLVENLDRLSREGAVEALREVIFKLWDKNITLQTLSPEHTFGPDCGKTMDFLPLTFGLQMANEASARKSVLIRASRDRARELARSEGRLLTGMVPAWLEIKDGRFEVIQKAAEVVRQIFELRHDGIGVQETVRKLNHDGVWCPPPRRNQKTRKWRISYVKKILSNKAVIGEYQPRLNRDGKRSREGEPISGYYPAVVPPELFYAVQQKRSSNRGHGGRTGKMSNVLRALVQCAYCGGPMHFNDKGRGPKGGRYLVCENGQAGAGCQRHSIKYSECETVVLENCPKLRPEQVLPNPAQQEKQCTALRRQLDGLDGELADIAQQIENYTDQVGRTPDASKRDRYEARITKLEEQQKAKQAEKNATVQTLRDAEQSLQSFSAWKKDFEALREGLAEPEIRMRLNAHLRELIDRIEVFADGHAEQYDPDNSKGERSERNGDTFAEELYALAEEADPAFARSKDFKAFIKEVMRRRMSKEGRFLRVHFKSGATVDLVPKGSLASGAELVQKERGKRGWRFVSPKLSELWDECQEKG